MSDDLKRQFAACGVDVKIDPGVEIAHPEKFHVGDRVHIMRNVTFISEQKEVRIGNDVTIFPNSFFQGAGRLDIGNNVGLYPNTYMSIGGREHGFISIGDDTHFAVGCSMYGAGGLTVGPRCAFAAHTVLTTVAHDHRITDRPLVKTGLRAPIHIMENVWTGANATVVPGITIAQGCVIGANAVLTKDTEENGVYLGVPARLAYYRDKQ